MATSHAPQLHTWALTGFHPLSGCPICLPWPQQTTIEVAAQIANAIVTTYSVTDLVIHPDDLSTGVTVLVLWIFNGRDRLAELPADNVDDAVVRMASLASSGTIAVLD
jgi:hypothetical protein